MNHQLSRWISKLYGKQSAQSLVEFAITLPILAVFLFGICQFGFIFAAVLTVRNASAVGARYAVVGSPANSNVQAVAKAAVSPMLNAGSATAVVTTTNFAGNTATSVQVTYNLPLIIPFVVPGKTAGGSLTLSASTVMR